MVIIEPGVINTGFARAMDQQLDDRIGPYKELKQIIAKVMQSISKPGQYSEPTVIAGTISKAIKTKNPKTRYAAGKMAKQSLLGRKLLSDKGFDKLFLRMVRNYGK